MPPSDKKRYLGRANRNFRALLKEKEQHGFINDGSGKRYRIGVAFILAGENRKALEYYSWFEAEFSEDVGEPVFDLYWVLAEYRNGNEEKARHRLHIAMLSNLYMIPFLVGEPIDVLDIQHSSNWEENDYLSKIEEFLDEPSQEERQWFKKEFHSLPFTRLREEYIKVQHALKYEKNIDRRGALLSNWDKFIAGFFEQEG